MIGDSKNLLRVSKKRKKCSRIQKNKLKLIKKLYKKKLSPIKRIFFLSFVDNNINYFKKMK